MVDGIKSLSTIKMTSASFSSLKTKSPSNARPTYFVPKISKLLKVRLDFFWQGALIQNQTYNSK